MRGFDAAMAYLRSEGISELTYRLDGGGDSGDVALEGVKFQSGTQAAPEYRLPELALDFDDHGRVVTLPSVLADHAAAAPGSNWWDNAGGQGTVTYLPFEQGEDCVVSDVEFNDEDDDGEDDFEDEEDGAPAAVDDDPDEEGSITLEADDALKDSDAPTLDADGMDTDATRRTA